MPLPRPPWCAVPYCAVLCSDLEGDEFEEDSVNLAAWQEAFQQHHYWAVPLGPVLAVGLSTVRFRSNAHRCEGGGCLVWCMMGGGHYAAEAQYSF